jgi:hypothetical protein
MHGVYIVEVVIRRTRRILFIGSFQEGGSSRGRIRWGIIRRFEIDGATGSFEIELSYRFLIACASVLSPEIEDAQDECGEDGDTSYGAVNRSSNLDTERRL